jgi:DNA-directed RNA polymerase subunit RPC12/RpoP
MPATTEFKFVCPTCGQHILVATHCIGLGITCPSCQSRITVPAPPRDEHPGLPAPKATPSGQTIRIELPSKANHETTRGAGPTTESKPTLVVTSTAARTENLPGIVGNEPWPDLVRKLEQGTLVAPAELVTALFHELENMRQRLDRLERQTLRAE